LDWLQNSATLASSRVALFYFALVFFNCHSQVVLAQRWLSGQLSKRATMLGQWRFLNRRP
jgi:hypothetical protein